VSLCEKYLWLKLASKQASKRSQNSLKRLQNAYETGTNAIEKKFMRQKSVHFCSSDERQFARYLPESRV
jgi:hypothetical protein